ncbi:MerR family transcriptional regulator [Corynebacterium sp. zg254]|uniref:Helix-turn-helix transcriptional regulator n=1 Tax=Corynebacterium zhongnanshanii TaxID=2768834 RepID=A0ABQ6VED2_9CORY|nr:MULTISPECIES: helix-turn-helix transcriptional regulator [Corynebacterium]KAB3519933.1 helix-turn-helix transcriptional regulator [Corynebacterium zhongnanshanii]MCR5914881.1 MerR family transcriptional regulator [Corynebacterium sp. zg254]
MSSTDEHADKGHDRERRERGAGQERGGHEGRQGREGEHGRKRQKKDAREVFVISVAAEITGMHAQTLRTYDRIGLVTPERTRGGGRRYSRDDIDQLREIQRLSHEEGVNLAGIKTIIGQQNRIRDLEAENEALQSRLLETQAELKRLLAAHNASSSSGRSGRSRGEIVHVPRSTAVVMWEPRRRRRDN